MLTKINCRSDICVTSEGNQNSVIALKESEKRGGKDLISSFSGVLHTFPVPPPIHLLQQWFSLCVLTSVSFEIPRIEGLHGVPWEAILPFVTCQFPDTSPYH